MDVAPALHVPSLSFGTMTLDDLAVGVLLQPIAILTLFSVFPKSVLGVVLCMTGASLHAVLTIDVCDSTGRADREACPIA